jgi:hypothetical protein
VIVLDFANTLMVLGKVLMKKKVMEMMMNGDKIKNQL